MAVTKDQDIERIASKSRADPRFEVGQAAPAVHHTDAIPAQTDDALRGQIGRGGIV